MTKEIKINMWLEAVSIASFIIGVVQEPINKTLLLVSVVLLPIVIWSYYASNDEIRKQSISRKILFVALQWSYLSIVINISEPIGIMTLICLIVVFFLRDKRIKNLKRNTKINFDSFS